MFFLGRAGGCGSRCWKRKGFGCVSEYRLRRRCAKWRSSSGRDIPSSGIRARGSGRCRRGLRRWTTCIKTPPGFLLRRVLRLTFRFDADLNFGFSFLVFSGKWGRRRAVVRCCGSATFDIALIFVANGNTYAGALGYGATSYLDTRRV